MQQPNGGNPEDGTRSQEDRTSHGQDGPVNPGQDLLWQAIRTADDIGDQEQAREQLARSQKFIAKTVNVTPAMITVQNVQTGRYVYVNEAVEKLLGYTVADVINGGLAFVNSIVHPDDFAGTMEKNQAALEQINAAGGPLDDTIVEFEYRIRSKDGRWVWLQTNGMVFDRDPEGKVQHLINVSLDVSSRKETETLLRQFNAELEKRVQERTLELERSNQELNRINAELDSFIYKASHDLKAPAANIEGLMDLLHEQWKAPGRDEQEVAAIMELISKSIFNFRRTVDDLTDLIQAQQSPGRETEQVLVEELIEDIQLGMLNEIKTAGASIIVDTRSCPVINFSRRNLRSILYNLLSNAIKYRSTERQPLIRIRTEKAKNGVLLTVCDNGTGIPAGYHDKVFSIFERLSDHTPGSGMGLYIVRKIIDNAGGNITLESEEGKGSTFRVFFRN